MQKMLLFVVVLMVGLTAFGQSGTKVKWDFTSKKLGDKKYEIRLIATIQAG